MSRATEIYAREFDSVFLNLPPGTRALIETKIQDLGARLNTHSHHRLKGAANIVFEWATTGSFTSLIWVGTPYI